jgi:hypothetical protein
LQVGCLQRFDTVGLHQTNRADHQPLTRRNAHVERIL